MYEILSGATSSEILLGLPRSTISQLLSYFSTIKWQKLAKFLTAEPKPLEIESFILQRKIAVRSFEKKKLCYSKTQSSQKA